MDTFAEIAAERRDLADLLAGLTAEQRSTPSLCAGWSVQDVAAHLVVPLEVGLPTFALAMLASRGDFHRANTRLTRDQARRPMTELVEVLRRKATSRFTPPGAGPEAPLTDLLVHGSDIRWPLGLERDVPPERLRASLAFVTGRSGRGFVARNALDGLRFEAQDLDWSHGSGPVVRGAGEAALLAVTGRPAALARLSGDGVPALRARLT